MINSWSPLDLSAGWSRRRRTTGFARSRLDPTARVLLSMVLPAVVVIVGTVSGMDGPKGTDVAQTGLGWRGTEGEVQLVGTLSVAAVDPAPGSPGRPDYSYRLSVNGDRVWNLVLTGDQVEAAGGLLAISGLQVVVRGEIAPGTERFLRVIDLKPVAGVQGLPDPTFQGSQPYVWILLRFADNPSTPQPPSWFEAQALGPEPSLDHYWRAASYDNISLQGSTVLDWLDLPNGHGYYVYDWDPDSPGNDLDLDRLLSDAFLVAEPHVDFRLYSGINFCFNDTLDENSCGWRQEFLLDGEIRDWGWTALATWGWENHNKIAHEMGHSFWLLHTTGPGPEIGDSWWDIMSHDCGTCQIEHPVFGYMGVNPISHHRDTTGWISPDRRFVLPTSPAVTSLWLNDLAVVPPAGRFLTVRSRNDIVAYYTVERRCWTGYDEGLPDETVIIHEIVPARREPAWVVDGDGNGDCNDEGGRWDLGETFWDASHGFVITVDDVDDTGSMVTLSNAGRNPVYVDRDNSGYEDGSPTYPWNSVYEGHGSVYPVGDVYIAPGNYPEVITFRKAATLRRLAATGVVTIGE